MSAKTWSTTEKALGGILALLLLAFLVSVGWKAVAKIASNQQQRRSTLQAEQTASRIWIEEEALWQARKKWLDETTHRSCLAGGERSPRRIHPVECAPRRH